MNYLNLSLSIDCMATQHKLKKVQGINKILEKNLSRLHTLVCVCAFCVGLRLLEYTARVDGITEEVATLLLGNAGLS